MKDTIARNLRLYRGRSGLSQVDLAQRCGLSQTWISRLETGMANPTIETIERLAQTLEVDAVQLLSDPEPRERPEAEVA